MFVKVVSITNCYVIFKGLETDHKQLSDNVDGQQAKIEG